jgi:hypothetical protein
MAQSWIAKGLVKEAWSRLGVTNGRDSLAQLTGIPGTNLSAMNTGKKRMTVEQGQKIAKATGATLLELGAPVAAVAPEERSLFDLLATAQDEAERGRGALLEALTSIDVRLSRIEKQLGLQGEQDWEAHP